MPSPEINVNNLFSSMAIVRGVVDMGALLQEYKTVLSLFNQFALDNDLYQVQDSLCSRTHACVGMFKMQQSACKYLEAMQTQRDFNRLPQ